MTAFAHTWAAFVGSFATIALILVAIEIMVGLAELTDALKYAVTILGIAILLMLIPGMVTDLWFSISRWQKVELAVLGIAIVKWRRRKQKPVRR